MSGSALAVLSALSFACTNVVIRRAVIQVPDAALGVVISVPLGMLFFMCILAITGEMDAVVNFPWQSYIWLSAAGILHYVVGRSFSYNCTKLVGANIASILTRAQGVFAVILGISVLGEPLTWQVILGVLLITLGLTLPVLNKQAFRDGQSLPFAMSYKALLFGLGAGAAWGITPILIKVGLNGSGSPVAGALITFFAATITLSISLLNHKRCIALASMTGRTVGLFCGAGMLSATAQLLRFVALSIAPASIIAPLTSISPFFLIILSFLFNRKIELFNVPVVVGIIAVVIGTLLLV